ncbi:MAG TPA: hypothetical protein VF060_11160 [Trebonia sp.]
MPDNDEHDPLESWLNQQVRPLPPPPGTFDLITRRARRRKLRRAAVTVASGAVVAAGVVVATTNPTLLHLTPPSETGQVVAGNSPSSTASTATGTPQLNGPGTPAPPSPSAAPSARAGQQFPGPVPANFAPSSVTFVSSTRAWVIGQAGTPGSCYNGSICTSVAWTSDGGSTWHGEHAPVAGAPSGANGVSGIRFLDGVNGWAFGPGLWATHDGGDRWQPVSTSGQRVTDLEAAGDRAYALFATCSGNSAAGFAADCTSYTLMTTTAGSDNWVPAGSATSDLSASGTGGSPSASGSPASAMLALTGSTGYLVAPDGTVYSGPLGGTWTRAGTAPCQPSSPPQASGLPSAGQLAQYGSDLAMACDGGPSASSPPAIWTSSNGGANWTQQASGAWSGTSDRGTMTSFAAAPDGSLVLATTNGIYVLGSGASQWQQATAANGNSMPSGGFSYVGMTSDSRGVALPADTSQHEIWVTTDGGQTWTARAIS